MFRFLKGKWVSQEELSKLEEAKLDLVFERSSKGSNYTFFLREKLKLSKIIEEKEKIVEEKEKAIEGLKLRLEMLELRLELLK